MINPQQGFLYEKNVAEALKKLGWVKPGYVPAGAAADRPDLEFFYGGKSYGCELKKDLASSGSLIIHHLGNKKYEFGETEENIEKEFLKGLGQQARVLETIKTKWRTEPFIQKDRDQKWADRAQKSGLNLRGRYDHDRRVCPDIYFQLPNNAISNYYNLKNTYYINVSNYGFYLLGKSDPANLNKDKFGVEAIPLWDLKHTSFLRIRIQPKNIIRADQQEQRTGYVKPGAGQGYQITMEIQFKAVQRSNFNIGPTIGKSAMIDLNKILLP
jgi:hypothetical protein